MSARKRHILAVLAAAEIHVPADYDMTTTDVCQTFPDYVPLPGQRGEIVRALHSLQKKGYVSSGYMPTNAGRLGTWKVTTAGLRVALGALA